MVTIFLPFLLDFLRFVCQLSVAETVLCIVIYLLVGLVSNERHFGFKLLESHILLATLLLVISPYLCHHQQQPGYKLDT